LHYGTLFQLRVGGFTGIASFLFSGTNGRGPTAKLLEARDGNLYGTTTGGGAEYTWTNGDWGTVFRVTPAGEVTSLFSLSPTNGSNPSAGLVEGSDGWLYGTTTYGGAGYGTIFKITTNGVFTRLVAFNNVNGATPAAELVEGNDGNFYGTTSYGGSAGHGTIFRVTPNGVLTALLSFNPQVGYTSGFPRFPQTGLVKGIDGNLYGTTSGGGLGYGTFFRLTPPPVITSILKSNGNVLLTWTSFTNGLYRVEYKTNPTNTMWLTLDPGVTAVGGSVSVSDPMAGGAERYYRIVLSP